MNGTFAQACKPDGESTPEPLSLLPSPAFHLRLQPMATVASEQRLDRNQTIRLSTQALGSLHVEEQTGGRLHVQAATWIVDVDVPAKRVQIRCVDDVTSMREALLAAAACALPFHEGLLLHAPYIVGNLGARLLLGATLPTNELRPESAPLSPVCDHPWIVVRRVGRTFWCLPCRTPSASTDGVTPSPIRLGEVILFSSETALTQPHRFIDSLPFTCASGSIFSQRIDQVCMALANVSTRCIPLSDPPHNLPDRFDDPWPTHWQARREHLAWRVFADEGKLVDLLTGVTHTLNAVATLLWEHMQRGVVTETELLGALCEQYDVPRTMALQHVRDFLTNLAHVDLLDISAETTRTRDEKISFYKPTQCA